VTRFHVIRDFRKVAGLAPAAFIRDRRLRHAGGLIRQASSLAESAAASGFVDQSHLSRVFRAMRGISPGMYQKVWRR
jgi:AraC-like DNA-binding protein